MALSDLASIGSFVSGVAVLISLIYLGLQVRQAERNQRALMQQGRATFASDLLLRVADPGLIGGFTRGSVGDVDISPSEFTQFIYVWRANLTAFEDTFFQHNQKLLDNVSFESTVMTLRLLLTQPGRAMWQRFRPSYVPSFRAFVDKLVADVPVAPPVVTLAMWKADVTELKTVIRPTREDAPSPD